MFRKEKIVLVMVIGLFGWLSFAIYTSFFFVPEKFPQSTSFFVKENETLQSISNRLQEEGFVTSSVAFRVVVSFLGKDKEVQIGEYFFNTPVHLLDVVNKITNGKPDAPLVSVTVPEGSTLSQIATLFSQKLPSFSQENFFQQVKEKNLEGKLFPSTYYPLPSFTEVEVATLMYQTFEKRVKNVFEGNEYPKPLQSIDEVVILASLVEGEAKTKEDMRIIAGILLKRLSINMPLQVDVATSTYKTRGLPDKAINSPGMNALGAVMDPLYTEYLYYITGNDGAMYYAKTFLEHRKNIINYLK